MRLTMEMWQQQCSSCHFVAPSLDENSTNVSGLLVSEAYQSVLNDKRLPRLARRFICRGMIEEARKKWSDAARYLEAAWVTDDAAEQHHDSEPQSIRELHELSIGELHELMMLFTADRPETIADRP